MSKGLKTKVIFHGDLVSLKKEPEKEELIYNHICPECGAKVRITSLWDIDTDIYKFGALFDYECTEYRCTCRECGCRFNKIKVKKELLIGIIGLYFFQEYFLFFSLFL